MDNTTVQNLLNELLIAVITVAIPIITKYIIAFVDAKRAQIEADAKYTDWENTIDAVTVLIKQTVVALDQTVVDTAKKNGVFGKDAQEKVFRTAYDTVMEQLNDNMKNVIVATYGNLSTWLTNEIEHQVAIAKL